MTYTYNTQPDRYYDFVYARLTADVGTSDSALFVDDVSLFPTDFSSGQFWMTIESTLTYPNTFEIVEVYEVDTVSKVLYVNRGVRTGVSEHTFGTYIKSTVTADMLKNIGHGLAGSSLPTADLTVYDAGTQFYLTSSDTWYYMTSTPSWEAMGSGSSSSGGLSIAEFSSIDYHWPTENDLFVLNFADSSIATQPLSAGTYYVAPGHRAATDQVNHGAADFSYELGLSLGMVAGVQFNLTSNMTYNQSVTLSFTGLNEGDPVGVALGNEFAWDYAASDGTATITSTVPTMGAVSSTTYSPTATIKLITTSTTVTVASMVLHLSMVEGTPNSGSYTPTTPDNAVAGATDLTSGLPSTDQSWTLDSYGSVDILCAPLAPLGGNGIYNPRYFTLTAGDNGDLTVDAYTEEGTQTAIAVWEFTPTLDPFSGLTTPVAFDYNTPDAANNTGSSAITYSVLGGNEYFIAIGTAALTPPAGDTVYATIGAPAAPLVTATVVGTEHLQSAAGDLNSTLTVPTGTDRIVIVCGFSYSTGTTPSAFDLTVGGDPAAERIFGYDQHNTGQDGYGLGIYTTTPMGSGTVTLSSTASSNGLTLQGAIAVYLQNTTGTFYPSTPDAATYYSGPNLTQGGVGAGVGSTDLVIFGATSGAGYPTSFVGTTPDDNVVNLVIFILTPSDENATVRWNGDQNNQFGYIYVVGS